MQSLLEVKQKNFLNQKFYYNHLLKKRHNKNNKKNESKKILKNMQNYFF